MPCPPGCRERFSVIPLATRLSPFLQDPPALDLLLCCLASSAYDQAETLRGKPYGYTRPDWSYDTELKLPPTFPVAQHELQDVLDSFAPISKGVTLSQLLGPGE